MTAMVRSNRAALLVVSAILLQSFACASSGPRVVHNFPSNSSLSAMGRAVMADTPAVAEFDPVAGDQQPLMAIGYKRGIVMPHKQANVGGFRDGKVLARIVVEQDYPALGAKAGMSNWWVLHQKGTGWVSLIVAGDGTTTELPLSMRHHESSHRVAWARWLSHSAEVPWVTCDGGTCCCPSGECGSYWAIWW